MSGSRVPTFDYGSLFLCAWAPPSHQLGGQILPPESLSAGLSSSLECRTARAKTRQDLWLVLCWVSVQVGGFSQLPLGWWHVLPAQL